MKLKKPHCNFCDRDLQTVRVDGSATGEAELVDITFDVTINKDTASATPTTLSNSRFQSTSNPLRLAALVEAYVEDTAEEVRCPLCTKMVKIVRVSTKPIPQQGQPVNALQTLFGGAPGIAPGTPQSPFGMPQSGSFGQNQQAIMQMFDAKFTDQELADLLVDLDLLTANAPMPPKIDLLAMLEDYLYN